MNDICSGYKKYANERLEGKQNIISSFVLVYLQLKDRKVLDIGCSDGLYLKLFNSESVGIEQLKELVQRAKESGLKVINGDIQEILPKIPSQSFPAIFFSHVMEHLESPYQF